MTITRRLRVVLAGMEEDNWRLLHSSLCNEPSFQIVGVAGAGEGLLEIVNSERPDAVVVVLHLHGMGGLEAASRIRERSPHAYIVMLTEVSWPRLHAQSLAHGANELIDRRSFPQLVDLLLGYHAFLTRELEHLTPPLPARHTFPRLAWPV